MFLIDVQYVLFPEKIYNYMSAKLYIHCKCINKLFFKV